MENKLHCKYQEKKKVKEEISLLNKKLRLCLNMVINHNLLHQINITVKVRLKVIRHTKKLKKFYNRHDKTESQEPK